MKTILITFSLLITSASFAQSLKQKVADKNYTLLAYEKAAPMYAELAKKSKASTEVIRRAADSYRMLNATVESEKWYNKLVSKPDVQATDYYNYAQVLLLNSKYNDAENQMKKFHELKSDNSVAKRYTNSNLNYIKEIKKDSLNFEIKNVDAINTSESDFAPSYFNNKTELAFASNKENHGGSNKEFAWDNTSFLDLYKTKLDTAKQTAEKPSRYDKALKTTYHDGPVSFSPDGKTMLLTRSNYYDDKLQKSSANIVNIELYYATKVGDKWSELKAFPYNNKDYSVGQACFSPNGKTVYFVSDMPGTYGYTDIWETNYDNTNFTQPKNLGQEVNTEGREMFPFVDDDNLLLFATDGRLGLGGLDINMASVNGDATYIGNIGYPVNTNKDDFGLIYDTKTMKGYFASNREGGKGKDDIYAVKLKEKLIKTQTIEGLVLDNNTLLPLPNSRVYLFDNQNKTIDSTIADATGKYAFVVKDINSLQKVNASKNNYRDGETNMPTAQNKLKDINVLLNPKYSFICTVYDAKTKATIDSVSVTLIQTVKTDNKNYYTDNQGRAGDEFANKKRGDNVESVVRFEKKGYITTMQDLSLKLDTALVINLNEYLNTSLHKMEKGIDIAKTININPIYFDLAKWNIRQDAAIELDKIIKVMIENPTMVIELGSHTDCRASKAYNMKLSDKRAKSSAAYIISKGIDKKRIYGKGYGESKLINKCECEGTKITPCSEEEHQANRRTEFIIVKF